MNPFLSPPKTPFNSFPFEEIKIEHYLPAIEEGIRMGKSEIEDIVNNTELPSFKNTIEALEKSGLLAHEVSNVFFNMNSAETNTEIQTLAQEISPLLTAYSNDIILNDELYQRIEAVHSNKSELSLNGEQTTLLEKTYKSFVRNGARLNEAEKEKLRAIDTELSKQSLTFGENVLAESNAYQMHITNKSDLQGLPDGAIEAAALMAKEKGHNEGWVITLDYPSYIPFMTYADNRALRKELYLAFSSKAFKGNENDNQDIVKRIAQLRFERAQLLGYDSHAHFVLEERMAKSPNQVFSFLDHLLDHAHSFAEKELEELADYSQSIGGPNTIERWDAAYYSEKLKKEKFSIDDELLKPYFKLENVIDGVFNTASKLYGLSFEQRTDIPLYHEDVITYEVKKDGKHLAVFYADFFPRAGKRQGAWMTSYKDQRMENGADQRPHVSIVCNFTKPTNSQPSLLTFNEVTTLFHEFGHALHGMMAKGTYASLTGTSVYWDFVELPSQILENWCYEKECLDTFAKHYETGESIPESYIQKIKDSANFHSGLATIRQLSFGYLDMAWHSKNPADISDIKEFEKEITSKTDLYPAVEQSSTSCQFSHIFQGGYSSGYYSYKWAEVLDADAFEAFSEKGIFDPSVAKAFEQHVLSAGGSEHPEILYKRFRGRDADPKALLRRAGLVSE